MMGSSTDGTRPRPHAARLCDTIRSALSNWGTRHARPKPHLAPIDPPEGSRKDRLAVLRQEGYASDDLLVPLGTANVFVRDRRDSREGTLVAFHNGGFYSCYAMLLQGIIDIGNMGLRLRRIDCRHSLKRFKNPGHLSEDVYPVFLASAPRPVVCEDTRPAEGLQQIDLRVLQHSHYRELPIPHLAAIMRDWFRPSSRVLDRMRHLTDKYVFTPHQLIAVVYRGTDKGKEVTLAPPEAYLSLTQRLLEQNRDHRVLIQTDQVQVRRLFREVLRERCFFIDELPATESLTVMHKLLEGDKTEWAISLDAVTRLASGASILVDHTGNMGLFLALYRGNALQMYQFDSGGALIGPAQAQG